MKYTKEAVAWLLALAFALALPVAFAAELADGIYEATAPGMNGDITVHAAVMGGEIIKITADHSESAEVGAPAIDELIRRVIDVQDPDVDIVTGATQTSEAFVEAMKAALTQAGWEEEDFEMDIIQRWTPAPAAEVSAPQISFPGGQADQTGVNLVSGDTIVMNWHAEGDVQKYHVSIIDQNGAVIKAFDTTDEAGLIEASSLAEGEAYTLTVTAIPANGTLEANGVAKSARFALYIVPTPEPTPEATPKPTPEPTKEPAIYPMLRSDVLEGDWYKDDYVSYVLGNESVQRKTIRAIRFLDNQDNVGVNAWDVSAKEDGSIMAWVNDGTLTIAGRGGVTAPVDASFLFARYDNLESIDFNGCLNTGKTINMTIMFDGCSSLTSLDVSGFDTSNVTDMTFMFDNCSSLTSLDVSGFDTRNVTNMAAMFNACNNLTSLDVSGFDTSNVTNMEVMFAGCSSLTSLDVSSFDTSNVTYMEVMFAGCSSLTSLDVSGFDTSNVKNMDLMFEGCSSLTSLDVSGFETSNVTFMSGMFQGCSSLTSLDVSGFDTSNVTDMNFMFAGCSSLTSLDVSGFDMRNVEDMEGMFDGCDNLKSQDTGGSAVG